MNSNQSINKGFAADHARRAKALKILKVIEDAGKAGNTSLKLLDIGNAAISSLSSFADFRVWGMPAEERRKPIHGGLAAAPCCRHPRQAYPTPFLISKLGIAAGNGSIAFYLAQYFDVTSVDFVDQRSESEGYSFCPLDGERLPFDAQSFDIVISNHVIEHVADADVHLAEIGRVLKPDGLVYLATPNRLWPWEVHYRVLLLQYLPQELRDMLGYNYCLIRLALHRAETTPNNKQ
ncbi:MULTISPECIES: class I SAM-dependent methyltransferase [Methylotuvimicrobium]|nr:MULTISPECIES: class I SAM-dependent methyltransferase [Methylotuvimicrobium]